MRSRSGCSRGSHWFFLLKSDETLHSSRFLYSGGWLDDCCSSASTESGVHLDLFKKQLVAFLLANTTIAEGSWRISEWIGDEIHLQKKKRFVTEKASRRKAATERVSPRVSLYRYTIFFQTHPPPAAASLGWRERSEKRSKQSVRRATCLTADVTSQPESFSHLLIVLIIIS